MSLKEWPRLRAAVGNTPLVAAPTLGAQLHIPNLYLKDEGANPSGSVAARWGVAMVDAAQAAGVQGIVAASPGPMGASLAYLAKAAGLQVRLFESTSLSTAWSDRALAQGAKVTRLDDDTLEVVMAAQQAAREQGFLDATPASDPAARIASYAAIATELRNDLPGWPQAIAVPTREGTCVAGIGRALEAAGASKTRLLAATTKMGNPIVWSLAQHLESCEDLESKNVFPSLTSEPLACYHAHDGDRALKAIRRSGGWGYAGSDAELESLAAQLKQSEGLEALPAGVAGIAALQFAARFGRLEETGTHVAVIAGRP